MDNENITALLAAIQNGRPWLDRFTRLDYEAALQEYRARFAPVCREAVLSAGEDGIQALAESILDALAEAWAKQRPWNRSLVQMEDKQMIVCYLSIILLEDPACAPLEAALREGWAARWPKEAYKSASLEKIKRGFKPTFMGFTISFGDKEDDD